MFESFANSTEVFEVSVGACKCKCVCVCACPHGAAAAFLNISAGEAQSFGVHYGVDAYYG